MKHLITGLALLMVSMSFGQIIAASEEEKDLETKIKIEKLSIDVTVDSADEIRSTFTTKSIRELLDETIDGDEIVIRITCNGEKMSNGQKSNITYQVKGNSDDKRDFLKRVKKIRSAAIKYYESKK